MINDVLTGIYTLFSGSTIASNVSNHMYTRVAPQNTSFPFIVVDISNANADWDFTKALETLSVHFILMDRNTSESGINTYLDNLMTLYDDCTLSVSGYTFYYMHRMNINSEVDDEYGVRTYDVEYEVLISK